MNRMIRLKQQCAILALLVLALQFGVSYRGEAATAPGVVINEVAWAGSSDSANDEWIELYNSSSSAIDVSGWYIEDDGSSVYTIVSGSIAPHGYFLIEDSENVVSTIQADVVIALSLANTGDSLVLKTASGAVADTVNSSGGMWFAGNATTKASMERIDPSVSGDLAGNWGSAKVAGSAKGSLGSPLLATPSAINSVADFGSTVSFVPKVTGSSVEVLVSVSATADLYAYGFEIMYDPAVLGFVSAKESSALLGNGASTSFFYGLENGKEGTLIVGNSRLSSPAQGIDSEGVLVTLGFSVKGDLGKATTLSFGAESFLADSVGDIPASFGSVNVGGEGFVPVTPPASAVSGLTAQKGAARYSLSLAWQGNAEKYVVARKMPESGYQVLGVSAAKSFVDSDSVTYGGKLIPFVEYEYLVMPLAGAPADAAGVVFEAKPSSAVAVVGMETRGVRGDNDRSDRVDGRDLERLARSYTAQYGATGYDALKDTTFDGVIDGSDLIDIGVGFAATYSE